MLALDQAGLDGEQRARVEAALAVDPELAAELALIVGLLDPAALAGFWVAFAAACRTHARPAAAALAALEHAAIDRGRERSP